MESLMRLILIVPWDCHVTSSLVCTKVEVPARHPGHCGAVGGESYRSETEKRGGPCWRHRLGS